MTTDPVTPASSAPPTGIDGPSAAGREAPDAGVAHHVTSDRAVAVLLAFAAVVAAIITLVAANASSDASSSWQSALRQEVARGALGVQQIQYVYEAELPAAVSLSTLEIRAETYRSAAASAAPDVATQLTAAADALQMTIDALRPNVEMATPGFALPGGGYDPVRKLAAEIAADPPSSFDPDAAMAQGDAAAARADRLMVSLVIIGFAFLAGALAQPLVRHRGLLVAVGWMALATGIVLALAGGFVA